MSTAKANADHESSIKETITSVVIAFVVAFVFRGFVFEPFLIPTGSMAPSLLGAHMRFDGPTSGYSWTTEPKDYANPATQTPADRQGTASSPVRVTDPMTGDELTQVNIPTRAGDRIFVLKSIYSFVDPKRFDVVVFKNPTNPQENYIKRLIGLPGEQIALVDGDVFSRPAPAPGSAGAIGPEAWAQPGWTIARKPEREQRAVWQPVFDSRHLPPPSLVGTTSRRPLPWIVSPGWSLDNPAAFEYTGTAPTTLAWNSAAKPITDSNAYNETAAQKGGVLVFPTADIRVSFAYRPSPATRSVSVGLAARGHEFETRVQGTSVTIAMRRAGESAWSTLASAALDAAPPADRFTDLDVWHVDQSLHVWVDGKPVCQGTYDWSPAQRFEFATGRSIGEALAATPNPPLQAVTHPSNYKPAQLAIAFDAGPVTVTRLAVSRDLYYQPEGNGPMPAAGADPRRMPTLSPDQFMMCGDNSPRSLDGRYWTSVDPWVAKQIDPTIGVVHRDLLVGKAFFVYFPAAIPEKKLYIPDFGRLRFIW